MYYNIRTNVSRGADISYTKEAACAHNACLPPHESVTMLLDMLKNFYRVFFYYYVVMVTTGELADAFRCQINIGPQVVSYNSVVRNVAASCCHLT